jgi:hypothetical protein
VNSFDLFDTLCAAPDPAIGAGEQGRHFPIAENLAKVQPGDQIISDYHTPGKAEKIVRETLRLGNPLHVSEDDKHSGKAWKLFRPNHHTGDNQFTDLDSPRRAGITAALTTAAKQTEAESYLAKIGMPSLANLIREARLSSYHPALRPFELLQTQVNFPLLFVASVLLHRIATHHTDAMMSSRDCFLWAKLQEKVRDLAGGGYRVHYFLTSRIARMKASPAYLRYTNALLGAKPLVVDLCGYGRTLPALLGKTQHPDAPIYLLAKYQDPERRTSRVQSFAPGNSWIERANLAQHAMVVDVDDKGKPIFSNPANINWENIEEIKASHESFLHTLSLMQHYDFTHELQAREPVLRTALDFFLQQLNSGTHRKALTFQGDRLLLAEEEPILQELGRLAKAPAPAAQGTTIVTRLHCEMPYFGMLAQSDGLTPAILARLRSDGRASVGSNSERMARDFEIIVGKPCFYLPSVYHMPPTPSRQESKADIDNVACFGRVFCLKNINVQAIAALRFAQARKHRLRFHINDFTQDAEGKAIVASLKMLFEKQPDAELVLHKWYPRDAFLRVLNSMTIGLQVSLTEASNVISLDMAAAGLPVVVSPEIKWATAQSTCYPTDSEAIANTMLHAMAHPELIEENRRNIQAHNDSCFAQWQKFIGAGARVLFLVHNALNTGISTVAANDCAMLKANGIHAEIVRTTFAPDAVKRTIQDKKPTHVISEASFCPLGVL